MVKSMTGYGSAQFENDIYSLSVEVKSLNSKFLDIVSKLPKEVSGYENELRKCISDRLVRGKINYSVEVSFKTSEADAIEVNKEVFENYTHQLKALSAGLKIEDEQIFSAVMNMPELFNATNDQQELIDKDLLIDLTNQAIESCDQYRIDEGKSIEQAMADCGTAIAERLKSIESLESERIEQVRSKILESLTEIASQEKYDANRFEQELIYYIEKLDISEERVRLSNHLEYFEETLANRESQGKKLGFISQEMGREINTIGSKANHSEIQKLVVEMKDELEQIKEQVLNIV